MVDVKTEAVAIDSIPAQGLDQSTRATELCLAHISDLHLTSLSGVKISQLLNKRMLGYFSWRRKRRIVHRLDIVDALLEDLKSTQPDHIAVTGDLTHLGLAEEFVEAARWLPTLGSPAQVTVIPGNHEAYAGNSWQGYCAMWAPYLESDVKQDLPRTAGFFPSLRIRGQVALIGLCSARPSLPFLAVGSLDQQQLSSLAALLKSTGEAGLLRVVMIHHPPVPGTVKWRKRLVGGRAFADVLASQGAELVLHGHGHTAALAELPSPAGSIPVIGAPSASELSPWTGNRAKYNIYRLRRLERNWQLTMLVRGYSEDLGRFVAEQELILNIPQDQKPVPATT